MVPPHRGPPVQRGLCSRQSLPARLREVGGGGSLSRRIRDEGHGPVCQAQGETESQGRPAAHTGYMGLSQPWTLFNGPLPCGKQ